MHEMYPGVLGLDSLIDEEGSSAYYAGKDLEKETSGFGMRTLEPNLYSQYGKSKEEFEAFIKAKEKHFKAIEQKFDHPNDIDEEKKQNKKIESFLSRKNEVDDKIDASKSKMEKLGATLTSLKETNQYFYRLTSPSPYMVAQQLYLKRQLEKKGVDTSNQIEVTQHLTRMNINFDVAEMAKNITGNVGPQTDNQEGDGSN